MSESFIQHFKSFCTGLRREGGQKNKFGLYQSPTCHGDTTFYGIAKSSFLCTLYNLRKVFGNCLLSIYYVCYSKHGTPPAQFYISDKKRKMYELFATHLS